MPLPPKTAALAASAFALLALAVLVPRAAATEDEAHEAPVEQSCGPSEAERIAMAAIEAGEPPPPMDYDAMTQVESLALWLRKEMADDLAAPPLKEEWETLLKLIEQDTEPDPDDAGPRIRRGVARDRQISLSDPDMRHGRKSKSKLFNGYKRHVATDLDVPGQGTKVETIAIDRGYLGADVIRRRHASGDEVICKPLPLRNGGRFTKSDFELDLARGTVSCPNGVVRPIRLGKTVRFPMAACTPCPTRAKCTRAKKAGRSLSIHPAEPLLAELRQRLKTDAGRKALRERIAVEHSLAAIGLRQGTRARYRGLRKNLFDLRRHAAVNNLHLLGEKAAA